ncbi:hypothetical protein KEM56_007062 [Ascosphaera pollenicola]|nr:hypothetical protein KEM56_007062 [Ascosphaera pollenicola]
MAKDEYKGGTWAPIVESLKAPPEQTPHLVRLLTIVLKGLHPDAIVRDDDMSDLNSLRQLVEGQIIDFAVADRESTGEHQNVHIALAISTARNMLIDLHDDLARFVEDENDTHNIFYIASSWAKYIAVARFCGEQVDVYVYRRHAPLLLGGNFDVCIRLTTDTITLVLSRDVQLAKKL